MGLAYWKLNKENEIYDYFFSKMAKNIQIKTEVIILLWLVSQCYDLWDNRLGSVT